jgi:hypothetical protein
MPTLREIQQWQPRSTSVRNNRRLALNTGIQMALTAPVSQRKQALSRELRKHPAVALSVLPRVTLKRVLLTLGFSLAAIGAVMHFPKLPVGGLPAMAPTPAGNAPLAARSWGARAMNYAPNRQQVINVGGAVATAFNPMFAVKWVVTSVTSRTVTAMDGQIGQYEQAANRARQNLEFYLSWTMFIAFLAVISHFIPRLAYNVRATVHVLTSGNAYQAATLAGRVGTKAIEAGGSGSRGRSRSRSRSRTRERARTLRIGAGMPTNTQLLARMR